MSIERGNFAKQSTMLFYAYKLACNLQCELKPLFSISYKRVRNSFKIGDFKSLYLHTLAHSFVGSLAFSTTSQKRTGGYTPNCPLLGFGCGLYLEPAQSKSGLHLQPAERKSHARKSILRKVRKLTPLFSISSALFCAFAQFTLLVSHLFSIACAHFQITAGGGGANQS